MTLTPFSFLYRLEASHSGVEDSADDWTLRGNQKGKGVFLLLC